MISNSAFTAAACRRITAGTVVLRPPEGGDRDPIIAGVGDWEVARWLARVPHPYPPEEADRFLARIAAAARPGGELAFVIADAAGFAGMISLSELGPEPELGYWIAPERWGRGYATAAGRALLALAFDELDAVAIRSGVFQGNEPSLAVQRRLGFLEVGRTPRWCLARQHDVEHIDTLLTRRRFRTLPADGAAR